MASIKLKFRPSSRPEREGTIYYQIIHDRVIRQLLTDYHIFSSEWDGASECLFILPTSERLDFLTSIKERIRWDIEQLHKISRKLDNEGLNYTPDDIIEAFNRNSAENSLFNFIQASVVRLKRIGKIRTSETYTAALRSFSKFR